jgi:hypothetical protein
VKVVVNWFEEVKRRVPGAKRAEESADPSRMPTLSIFVDLIRSSSAHRS